MTGDETAVRTAAIVAWAIMEPAQPLYSPLTNSFAII